MKRQYDFGKGVRGPVIETARGKTRITIRLDDAILAWFRTQAHRVGGGNYQTLINAALRDYMAAKREPLEETVRRVVREELRGYDAKKAR
ncbi:MAG: BrnA antitoxin family protein [Candidatus Polarisedimenticolia bacterium]